MVVLGFCYESGRGVRVDVEGAYLHYHQAARQGYEVGTWFLNELLTEHQGEVRTGMTRADSCASSVATSYSQAPSHAGQAMHGNARGGNMQGAQGPHKGPGGGNVHGQGNQTGSEDGSHMATPHPAQPPQGQPHAPGQLNDRMARANSNSIANLLAAHSQNNEHPTHIHVRTSSNPCWCIYML
jgi:TPR repeat protein